MGRAAGGHQDGAGSVGVVRKGARRKPVPSWCSNRDSQRLNPIGQAVFAFAARDLLRLTESPEGAGALLAGLATTSPDDPSGFQYWSNRVLGPGRRRFARTEPSAEARNDDLAAELWQLSAQAVGVHINAPTPPE